MNKQFFYKVSNKICDRPDLLRKLLSYQQKLLLKKELMVSRKVISMTPFKMGYDGIDFINDITTFWCKYESYKIPRILNPYNKRH